MQSFVATQLMLYTRVFYKVSWVQKMTLA